MQVQRDFNGIPGLIVALNCFSEEVERRLFLGIPSWAVYASSNGRTGAVAPRDVEEWSLDMKKLVTRVHEIYPDFVPPDYALGLDYPPGAAFQHHFDGACRWGESVAGVSLGTPGILYFVDGSKKGEKSTIVDVHLPRRSIYVMTGASRYVWQHGIRKMKPEAGSLPPSWNPAGARQSITLRTNKSVADRLLAAQLEAATRANDQPLATSLAARLKQSKTHNTKKEFTQEQIATSVATIQRIAFRERFSPAELSADGGPQPANAGGLQPANAMMANAMLRPSALASFGSVVNRAWNGPRGWNGHAPRGWNGAGASSSVVQPESDSEALSRAEEQSLQLALALSRAEAEALSSAAESQSLQLALALSRADAEALPAKRARNSHACSSAATVIDLT